MEVMDGGEGTSHNAQVQTIQSILAATYIRTCKLYACSMYVHVHILYCM